MGTIVVGIDGSPGGHEALRFALEEARLRKATLKVLFAWTIPFTGAVPFGMIPSMLSEFEAEAQRVLDGEPAEVGATEVTVERVLVEGAAAKALIEAAAGAELLIVGSRGRGGFKGLLLGSVSQQCAHHAPCPVVIVPYAEE